MNYTANPFQELYVTDSPDPRVFVKLFSDFPVKSSPALFRPGNVVLKGTQGSGKSMLLNLLKPPIRLAYAAADVPFPLQPPLDRFIGAGINLTRSGILDIGQRPLTSSAQDDIGIYPLYFADFLNYCVVRDLLSSLESMRSRPEVYDTFVRFSLYDEFAVRLAAQDCWFGFMAGAPDFSSLCQRLDRRISSYRAFHQYNGDLLPETNSTKTNMGEPIARAADCLRQAGVIGEETPVFIRIDQVERLMRSDVLRPDLGRQYRRMINKALATRDSRVYYRVGTRKHAWDADLTIYGTQDKLEHMRDFRIIDLDDIMQRKEDPKTWVFPDFAREAFIKRLEYAGYEDVERLDPIMQFFSATPRPEAAAGAYAGKASAERILKLDGSWSEEWRRLLGSIYEQSPLEAILAVAWSRQISVSHGRENRAKSPPMREEAPWRKTYWRKERIRQALLQIAARAPHRLKWSGKEHVLALSAGNISIFLSICHEIWDVLLRAERRKPEGERCNPIIHGIDQDVQAVGIQTASSYWYQKITEQPRGDDRKRFVDVLGATFRTWLLNDVSMSYPGRNGFSVSVEALNSVPLVKSFLEEAVNYGDLVDAPHTTKNKDRKQRRKFYLNPVLSDFFQIPESHTKEPYYATLTDVLRWLDEAQVCLGLDDDRVKELFRASQQTDSGTLPLLSETD